MMNELKLAARLDACFDQTPACFRVAIESVTADLPRMPRRAVRALLGAAALAAHQRWGVLSWLSGSLTSTTADAPALVATNLAEPVTLLGVTFEVVDAACDGDVVYVATRISAPGYAIEDTFETTKSDLPTRSAYVLFDSVDGRKVPASMGERSEDDGALYSIIRAEKPADSGDVLSVALTLCAWDEADREKEERTLRVEVPVRSDHNRTVSAFEPVAMNGLTLTALELNYTPLKLRLRLSYALDPGLDRFERARREYMEVALYDAQGNDLMSGSQDWEASETGMTFVGEFAAAQTPHDRLTVTLTGLDGEEYGRHTFEFKEDAR